MKIIGIDLQKLLPVRQKNIEEILLGLTGQITSSVRE